MCFLTSREVCFAVVYSAVYGMRLSVDSGGPRAMVKYGASLQGCSAPLLRAVAQRESSGFIPRAPDKRQLWV